MNAVVPACAISRFERLPVFRKKCCGHYTTISPEQTSRLKWYYAAERESVTAKKQSGYNCLVDLLVQQKRQDPNGHDAVLSHSGLGIARCHNDFSEEVSALAQRKRLLF